MSLEKTYHVSFAEVIWHVGTVNAKSEKAARTIVRRDWQEIGVEAFKQETLGISERIFVWEI